VQFAELAADLALGLAADAKDDGGAGFVSRQISAVSGAGTLSLSVVREGVVQFSFTCLPMRCAVRSVTMAGR
jgi:hypothetical protein